MIWNSDVRAAPELTTVCRVGVCMINRVVVELLRLPVYHELGDASEV